MDIGITIHTDEALLATIPLETICEHVLSAEGYGPDTELALSFVTTEEIHALNKEFRGIDRPTDVLSFECDESDDDFDMGAFNASEDAQRIDMHTVLGDIIIAPAIAREQTAQFGTTPEQEIVVLLVHGLLHLCGYDHVNSEEEAQHMEAREREHLAALGYKDIR